MDQLTFRKLRADEIDCRVSTVSQKGASLLLYKDARADQNLLDETVGAGNWQRSHGLINGNLFCSVGIRVTHDDGTTEWVWKQDVGTESYTEKEKGEASDSFKRACFNWGIGRELYTAPFIWLTPDKVNIENRNGKLTTHDRFTVGSIEYEGNKISGLTILDESGKTVYFFGKGVRGKQQRKAEEKGGTPTRPKESPQPERQAQESSTAQQPIMVGPVTAEYVVARAKEPITNVEAEALADAARAAGVDPKKIPPAYRTDDLLKLTYAQYYTLMSGKHWDYFKETKK